jgi:DNA repair exonuclease SbcCD nuclease subunit
MKFLHTADFQIGMKANHVGAASERVREQRLEAVRRLVDVAKENEADFILVAGDLFEDNGVDRTLVLKTVDILESFGRPVFIIPGNHDPLVPGSIWAHSAWKSATNIRVLGEEKPVEIASCLLYPCPIKDKFSTKDPTAWIPSENAAAIRLGIAHGNVEGLPQADPDHRIARNASDRARLDYLALGHWHSTAMYNDTAGAVRMAYSGTPEPSGFGERDSGNVLIVEIDRPGASPRISAIHNGRYRWETMSKKVVSSGEIEGIRSELEALQNPGCILLNLELYGALHTEDIPALRRLEDILKTRFAYSRINAEMLRPSPDDDTWIESLPAGFVREAAGKLQKIASSDRDEAGIAARALLELYVISGEASQ